MSEQALDWTKASDVPLWRVLLKEDDQAETSFAWEGGAPTEADAIEKSLDEARRCWGVIARIHGSADPMPERLTAHRECGDDSVRASLAIGPKMTEAVERLGRSGPRGWSNDCGKRAAASLLRATASKAILPPGCVIGIAIGQHYSYTNRDNAAVEAEIAVFEEDGAGRRTSVRTLEVPPAVQIAANAISLGYHLAYGEKKRGYHSLGIPSSATLRAAHKQDLVRTSRLDVMSAAHFVAKMGLREEAKALLDALLPSGDRLRSSEPHQEGRPAS